RVSHSYVSTCDPSRRSVSNEKALHLSVSTVAVDSRPVDILDSGFYPSIPHIAAYSSPRSRDSSTIPKHTLLTFVLERIRNITPATRERLSKKTEVVFFPRRPKYRTKCQPAPTAPAIIEMVRRKRDIFQDAIQRYESALAGSF
ncbi:unnamed protein product, partial [Ectocarpus sp. 12 AP-2014]